MEVKVRGHQYKLDVIFPEGVDMGQHKNTTQTIQFVNKEPGMESPGTTTQEIMRVLIDRTRYCHNCLPHDVNEKIVWHMRQIIALHEARALLQRAAKGGGFQMEYIMTDKKDGHIYLEHRLRDDLEEEDMKPVPKLGEFVCDFRSNPDGTPESN